MKSMQILFDHAFKARQSHPAITHDPSVMLIERNETGVRASMIGFAVIGKMGDLLKAEEFSKTATAESTNEFLGIDMMQRVDIDARTSEAPTLTKAFEELQKLVDSSE